MKKYKMSKVSWMILALVTVFLLNPAIAANDTAGVKMQIPSMCKLSINNSDQVIDLLQDASGEGAYEAGYVQGESNKPSLTVSSNTNWKLSAAVSIDWEAVEGYQKSTSDLTMKVTSSSGRQTGFADYAPLSLTDQEIARHTKGSGHDIYNCSYRIKLDWAKDVPGMYIIIITYTLSTQSF